METKNKIIMQLFFIAVGLVTCNEKGILSGNQKCDNCQNLEGKIISITKEESEDKAIRSNYLYYDYIKGEQRTAFIKKINQRIKNKVSNGTEWSIVSYKDLPLSIQKKILSFSTEENVVFLLFEDKDCLPFLMEDGFIKSSLPMLKGEKIFWL